MLGGNGTRQEEKWALDQRAEQQMEHIDQRGLGRGRKNEAGRAGVSQILAPHRVPGADSVNLGGGYECGRVPQAYPGARIWETSQEAQRRNSVMRSEGRQPTKGVSMGT